VVDFGKKEVYLIYPEELQAGSEFLKIQAPENRGDGTIITRVLFERHCFLLVEEC
jgi:hypothetical protein